MSFHRFVYRLLLYFSIFTFVSLFLFGRYINTVDDYEDEDENRIQPKQQEIVSATKLLEALTSHRHSLDGVELTKCLHLSNGVVFNRSNAGVLVFTRCNRQAAHFTAAIWRLGRSLLLVSEADCLQRTEFSQALPNSALRGALSVVAIDNDRCNASSLAAEISSRDVREVHVIIERDDFREGDSPHDLGDLQRCYVSLLEAIRTNRHVELFFHAHGHAGVVQRADDRFVQTGRDVAMCSYNYDAGHYGDVMKFILFMYTTVYGSLYEFRHIYLAAGAQPYPVT